MTTDPAQPGIRGHSEAERWRREFELKERELAVREADIKLRAKQHKDATWWNPIFVAIAAALLAGLANIYSTSQAATLQREAALRAAENERILLMLRAPSPEKATENLNFLAATGLVVDPGTLDRLKAFLATERRPGDGPILSRITDLDVDRAVIFMSNLQGAKEQGEQVFKQQCRACQDASNAPRKP